MCDACHIDEISIHDILFCLKCSVSDIYTYFKQNKITIDTFTKHDRLYYLIFILIIFLAVRCIIMRLCTSDDFLHRSEYQESDQSFWEIARGLQS